MSILTDSRCLNHPRREAVARCPECRQFFCRECVTEHGDRVVCAACLRALVRPEVQRRIRLAGMAKAGMCAAGVFISWLFFYWIAEGLLAIPDSFHEGTVWKTTFWEKE